MGTNISGMHELKGGSTSSNLIEGRRISKSIEIQGPPYLATYVLLIEDALLSAISKQSL